MGSQCSKPKPNELPKGTLAKLCEPVEEPKPDLEQINQTAVVLEGEDEDNEDENNEDDEDNEDENNEDDEDNEPSVPLGKSGRLVSPLFVSIMFRH